MSIIRQDDIRKGILNVVILLGEGPPPEKPVPVDLLYLNLILLESHDVFVERDVSELKALKKGEEHR